MVNQTEVTEGSELPNTRTDTKRSVSPYSYRGFRTANHPSNLSRSEQTTFGARSPKIAHHVWPTS